MLLALVKASRSPSNSAPNVALITNGSTATTLFLAPNLLARHCRVMMSMPPPVSISLELSSRMYPCLLIGRSVGFTVAVLGYSNLDDSGVYPCLLIGSLVGFDVAKLGSSILEISCIETSGCVTCSLDCPDCITADTRMWYAAKITTVTATADRHDRIFFTMASIQILSSLAARRLQDDRALRQLKTHYSLCQKIAQV